MSAKHTPGPWQSQHDFDRNGEYTIVGNVDGEIIDGHTHHSFTLVAEVYDNDARVEDLANACLIASAPDLLEPAQDAIDILEVAIDNWNQLYPHEPDEVFTDLQRRFREVVAKATAA